MALKDNVQPVTVRGLLDSTMPQEILPDTLIQSNEFAGAAADEIIQRVANAESVTGTDMDHILSALNRLTAALIAESESIPAYTGIGTEGGPKLTMKAPDWQAKAIKLRSRAYQELAIVLGQTSISRQSTMAVGHRTIPCGLLRTFKP